MEMQPSSDPERRTRPGLQDGLVGGLLGGVAVILLFAILDVIQGEPLATPAFLASALFQAEPETVGMGHIAAFTLIHLVIFAVVGGVLTLIFRLAQVPENVLLGGIAGLFAYTFLFYVALGVAGVPILEAPVWMAVMTGNFLAGVVLGGYLHWVGPRPGIVGLLNLLEEHPVLREGTIVGLLGAAVLAAWFFVVDLVLREAFFTPAALGSMLFRGADSPEAVVISVGTVLGYTVVHAAAFLLFGAVVAGIVTELEKHPGIQYAVVMFFAIMGVGFAALVTVLGVWILSELAIWSVLLGNLLAALAMGTYLWRAHPALRGEILSGALWRES